MQRRTLLRRAAGVSGVGLAGCAGGGGGDGGGGSTANPEDEQAEQQRQSKEKKNYKQAGATHTFDSVIDITISQVQAANRIVSGEDEKWTPDDGKAFIFAKVSATNTSDETVDLPARSEFACLAGDEQAAPLDLYLDRYRAPVSGGRYEGTSGAHPEVTSSGWVGFEISRDAGSPTIAFSREVAVRDEFETRQLYWETSVDPGAPPNTSLKSVVPPAEPRIGEKAVFEVVVENTGEQAGTFSAPYELEPPYRDGEDGQFSINVDGGGEGRKEVSYEPAGLGDLRLTIGEDSVTTTKVQPAEVGVGEKVDISEWGSWRLGQLTESTAYEWDGFDDPRKEAGSGSKFVFAFFEVKHSEEGIPNPPYDEFGLVAGEQTFDAKSYEGWGDLTNPVSGEVYSSLVDEGWVIFEVPEGLSTEEMEFYTGGEILFSGVNYGARWVPE